MSLLSLVRCRNSAGVQWAWTCPLELSSTAWLRATNRRRVPASPRGGEQVEPYGELEGSTVVAERELLGPLDPIRARVIGEPPPQSPELRHPCPSLAQCGGRHVNGEGRFEEPCVDDGVERSFVPQA